MALFLWPMLTLARSLRVVNTLLPELRQDACEVPGNRAIAFARRFLKLGTVEYGYAAPRVSNGAALPERSSDTDDRGPVHPQHLREIVLGQGELISGDAILRG